MSAPKSIMFKGQVYRLAEADDTKTAAFQDVNDEVLAYLSAIKHKADHIKGKGLMELNFWIGHLTEALFPQNRHAELTQAEARQVGEINLAMAQASRYVTEAMAKAKGLTYDIGRSSLPYEAQTKEADVYTPSKGEADFSGGDLQEAWPELDDRQAYDLAEMAKRGARHKPDMYLNAVNQAIDAFGIEAIRGESSDDEPLALYVNTGDAYTATILYDTEEGKFYLTTYGDWLEAWEHEHGRQVP